MASLSDVIDVYTSDISAQSALLIDYLKGLTYLHDQKGIMHRDVNPNNLGVVSFHPPRGVLLDLDSVTREEESLDHMQGTVPYLAPEIMELKHPGLYSTAAATRPVPYRKGVDVWAMGLTVFALYIGHHLNWGPYTPKHADHGMNKTVNHVQPKSYQNFHKHLQEKRVTAHDHQAGMLLELVGRMTEWNAKERIRANEALDTAQDLITGKQAGFIELKTAPKRALKAT